MTIVNQYLNSRLMPKYIPVNSYVPVSLPRMFVKIWKDNYVTDIGRLSV